VQRVRNDVARALITAAAARDAYGVILSGADTITIDQRATRDLRERLQRDRDGRAPARYDFGERPGQPPHSQQ
jgi:hypothetical protein